ncbi:MAG: lysylphosphatidylglycerol synthase domain-containing protein [Egibacteraceae bacterium]
MARGGDFPPPGGGKSPRAAGLWILVGCALALALALRGRVAAVGGLPGFLPGVVPFAAAVALNTLANGVVVTAWRAALAAAGTPLEARAAARVWSVSQLARYTVGAAQIGGREVAGRRCGLPAWAGATTALVEICWSGAVTAAIALATAPWWLPGAAGLAWLAWAAALPVAVLLVGLARPDLPPRLAAAVLGRLRRAAPTTGQPQLEQLRRATPTTGQPQLEQLPRAAPTTGQPQLEQLPRAAPTTGQPQLGRAAAARITGLYLLNSVLRVSAFLALFAAVGGTLPGEGLRAAGALALGQLVGWLAVFAPGGLGPREGATALAAAPATGPTAALVLVAATRLAELAAEALFAAAAHLAVNRRGFLRTAEQAGGRRGGA